MKKAQTEKRSLVPSRRKESQSFEELVEARVGQVAAALWTACCWVTANVGDYRFVIFEIRPDAETCIYVQFWSEPAEPVLCEVCSGNWNPPAVKLLRPPQRRAIESLGYKMGGQAGNYQKEVAIESMQDAETMAQEVLVILHKIFGYCGQWPFDVKSHQGSRAENRLVYDSMTPDDFLKCAKMVGYAAVKGPHDARPAILLRRRGLRSVAFLDRHTSGNLFGGVTLSAELGKGTRRPELMQRTLLFQGGVTVKWLCNELGLWWNSHRQVLRARRRGVRPVAALAAGVH